MQLANSLIQRLALIHNKLSLLSAKISLSTEVMEIKADLSDMMAELLLPIDPIIKAKSLDLLDRLHGKDDALYEKLLRLDYETNGAIFHDKHHTISWTVATYAKAGNPLAIEICEAFSKILQPDHCAHALANE